MHRNSSEGFSPGLMGTQTRDVVDARWVLTWKVMEGQRTVKASLVAKGYQDPDLRDGDVDLAGCVSRRS